MADNAADTPADGYYGDDDSNVEELDLSFLDEEEPNTDKPSDKPAK